MTSGTVSSLFVLLLSSATALAQIQQAQFNQVLNLNGDMKLNSFMFPDRSKVETFSQKQQQLIVNQNTPPIPASQVTGSTGQPFVALMAQSMSINTNGATDLVGGQIELAMDPQMLSSNAVNPDNTFVAKLSPDRQTWMIQETMRSVNITDMTVRMVKRQNIDGEYMALGRQTVETNAFLTNFGSDGSTQVAIQGTGLQENEFQDGFRMSVKASQPMTMNVDVKEGIDTSQLTALQGQMPVNDFRYSVITNLAGVQPNLNRQVTVVQMPLNAQRIQNMMMAAGIQPGGQVSLSVAQRGILQNPGGATGQLSGPTAPAPAQRRGRDAFRQDLAERQVQGQTGQTQGQAGVPQAGTPTNNNPVATQLLLAPTFTPINAQLVLDPVNMRVAFPVAAVDGEYILTMSTGATAQAQPQAAAPQGETPPTAGQQPTAEAPKPAAEAPKPAAEGTTPPRPGAASNGTVPSAEAPKAAAEAPKAERREDKNATSSTEAPLGSVFITMKEVNKMVELEQWGGQAPITQMMSNYAKANPGLAKGN